MSSFKVYYQVQAAIHDTIMATISNPSSLWLEFSVNHH